MATSPSITRRGALIGALVSSAALAVPAAAAVHVGEEPNAKVRRLQKELSQALAELMVAPVANADYVSIVFPSGTAPGYERSTIDREIFESSREREVMTAQAIAHWRHADDDLKAAMNPFDRTRWEFASLDENEARNAMLRFFRTL